jgi:hypothetical protein
MASQPEPPASRPAWAWQRPASAQRPERAEAAGEAYGPVAESSSRRPAAVLWSERPAVPALVSRVQHLASACRPREADPSALPAVQPLAVRRASESPPEAAGVEYVPAVQRPAGAWLSAPCAVQATAVEEAVSSGAQVRPPEAALPEPSAPLRVAAEAPVGFAVEVVAAAVPRALAEAVVQPRAAVARWAAPEALLPAAVPDALAQQRAELPSAAASCPCHRVRERPAPAPSERPAPARARSRIASP